MHLREKRLLPTWMGLFINYKEKFDGSVSSRNPFSTPKYYSNPFSTPQYYSNPFSTPRYYIVKASKGEMTMKSIGC